MLHFHIYTRELGAATRRARVAQLDCGHMYNNACNERREIVPLLVAVGHIRFLWVAVNVLIEVLIASSADGTTFIG
jgi:hypothetical protein